jgi:tRNA pseudouridine55 synthase
VPQKPSAAGPDGLLVVDKPAGITSHDVVARVRKLAATRKVGHAGTLDPMATGVLVLGLGRATRLLGHLALTDKTYVATARLGVTTVTDDADGEITGTTPAAHLDLAAVRAAAAGFVGTIEQVPSSVSAVKQDGRHAYDRVRAGEDVVLAPRTVTISELTIAEVRPEGDHLDVDLTVVCSSGTYVRAIARDLGTALGVGGHLTMLRRTRVGPFTLEDPAHVLAEPALSVPVPSREERTDEVTAAQRAALPMLTLADAVTTAFPRVDLDAAQALRVENSGRATAPASLVGHDDDGPFGVFGPEGLLALMDLRGETLRSLIVFSPANLRVKEPARIDP